MHNPQLPMHSTMERLPVPEFHEQTQFQHSFRQQASRRADRPPKLKVINRSSLSTSFGQPAQGISFGENGELVEPDTLTLSPHYDREANESYFEQCFTNVTKIGEGSFGEVFKVRSKQDNNLYAVKKSKQMFRSGSYRHERLEEVRRYQQLSGHANCVQFYRAWEQDDRLYMQMELCRESLESYLLRQRHIPEAKVWSILLDLVLPLKTLHDLNLIHLDIKLDNVLMGSDDMCKLADFGLVIDLHEATMNATEGDSRYIAPEIMSGHFSKAADIFSLGIAMLELACCLELPANGILWQQLRSGKFPEDFMSAISEELRSVIKRMMHPDPQQRPTCDELLRHRQLQSLLRQRRRWQFVKKLKHALVSFSRSISTASLNLMKSVCTITFGFLAIWAANKNGLLHREPSTPLTVGAMAAPSLLVTHGPGRSLEFSPQRSHNTSTPLRQGPRGVAVGLATDGHKMAAGGGDFHTRDPYWSPDNIKLSELKPRGRIDFASVTGDDDAGAIAEYDDNENVSGAHTPSRPNNVYASTPLQTQTSSTRRLRHIPFDPILASAELYGKREYANSKISETTPAVSPHKLFDSSITRGRRLFVESDD